MLKELNKKCKGYAAILLLWGGCILLGVLFFNPTVKANDKIQGDSLSVSIEGVEFATLAEEKIKDRLTGIGEVRRYDIKLISGDRKMKVPQGEIEGTVELPNHIIYGKSIPVNILVSVDGKFYRRITLYYRIVVYDNVLIATQDIGNEKPLTADNTRLEEVEVEEIASVYYHDIEEVKSLVATRIIRRGTVIHSKMLGFPMVMKYGIPIKLVTNYNGVIISVEGVALEKGRIGQVIKVRNNTSSKVLRGRIIDAETVEIIG